MLESNEISSEDMKVAADSLTPAQKIAPNALEATYGLVGRGKPNQSVENNPLLAAVAQEGAKAVEEERLSFLSEKSDPILLQPTTHKVPQSSKLESTVDKIINVEEEGRNFSAIIDELEIATLAKNEATIASFMAVVEQFLSKIFEQRRSYIGQENILIPNDVREKIGRIRDLLIRLTFPSGRQFNNRAKQMKNDVDLFYSEQKTTPERGDKQVLFDGDKVLFDFNQLQNYAFVFPDVHSEYAFTLNVNKNVVSMIPDYSKFVDAVKFIFPLPSGNSPELSIHANRRIILIKKAEKGYEISSRETTASEQQKYSHSKVGKLLLGGNEVYIGDYIRSGVTHDIYNNYDSDGTILRVISPEYKLNPMLVKLAEKEPKLLESLLRFHQDESLGDVRSLIIKPIDILVDAEGNFRGSVQPYLEGYIDFAQITGLRDFKTNFRMRRKDADRIMNAARIITQKGYGFEDIARNIMVKFDQDGFVSDVKLIDVMVDKSAFEKVEGEQSQRSLIFKLQEHFFKNITIVEE